MIFLPHQIYALNGNPAADVAERRLLSYQVFCSQCMRLAHCLGGIGYTLREVPGRSAMSGVVFCGTRPDGWEPRPQGEMVYQPVPALKPDAHMMMNILQWDCTPFDSQIGFGVPKQFQEQLWSPIWWQLGLFHFVSTPVFPSSDPNLDYQLVRGAEPMDAEKYKQFERLHWERELAAVRATEELH